MPRAKDGATNDFTRKYYSKYKTLLEVSIPFIFRDGFSQQKWARIFLQNAV